jgi:ribonuclease BN (tRNA processing enzyme)
MTRRMGLRLISALGALFVWPTLTLASCASPNALQVLGSGGPDANDARASSGYAVWIDGEARLLIDAGGGVFLRFGEAKAKFETLDAIAITHLHADHVADLPALLKSGFFGDRDRPLPIIGPTGSEAFPSMTEFLNGLFDARSGLFRYLSGYLDGSGGLVKLDVQDVDAGQPTPRVILSNNRVKLTAVGVTHGPVPALGFLIEVGAKKMAISGDLNRNSPAFTKLATGADILVVDHAIPNDAGEVEQTLHIRPADIGALANDTGAGRLVLSHNMSRSLKASEDSIASIKSRYDGQVQIASDLDCLAF